MAKQLTTQDVLAKVKGKAKTSKGRPKPKKTPAFARYKNENRAFHHQVKRIEKHIANNPNDKPAASALTRIRNEHFGIGRT